MASALWRSHGTREQVQEGLGEKAKPQPFLPHLPPRSKTLTTRASQTGTGQVGGPPVIGHPWVCTAGARLSGEGASIHREDGPAHTGPRMPRESAKDGVTFVGPAHSKAELGLGSWTGRGHLWSFRSPSSLTTTPDPRDQPVTPQALYKQDSFCRGPKSLLLELRVSPKRLPPGTRRQRGQVRGRQASKPLSGRGLRACTDADGQACRRPGAPDLPHSPSPCPPLDTIASRASTGRMHGRTGGRSCPHTAGLHAALVREGGRREGNGGTQSKQEDRRFHTPDSRQWTE